MVDVPEGSDRDSQARAFVEQRAQGVNIDAAACESEPIRVPGLIQPHGALIGVDPTAWRVVLASANLAEYAGVEPAAVLDAPLGTVLPADLAALIATEYRAGNLSPANPERFASRLELRQPVDCWGACARRPGAARTGGHCAAAAVDLLGHAADRPRADGVPRCRNTLAAQRAAGRGRPRTDRVRARSHLSFRPGLEWHHDRRIDGGGLGSAVPGTPVPGVRHSPPGPRTLCRERPAAAAAARLCAGAAAARRRLRRRAGRSERLPAAQPVARASGISAQYRRRRRHVGIHPQGRPVVGHGGGPPSPAASALGGAIGRHGAAGDRLRDAVARGRRRRDP